VRPEYGEAAARLVAPGAAAVPDLPDLPDLPPVPPPAAPDAAAAHAAATAEPKEEERPVFRPGVVIAGRYKLEERVGAGGMSVVFRATDFDLGDEIALKVLTHAVFDPETDARLRRELMLSRQLLHPNVVRVFEMGLAQGFRYLTMELLVGHKLADRLHSGPIGLDEGLGYLAQACAGLQAAHDLGIVHRDVKPNNFFITEGHVLKVMDFGLAKVRGAQGLTASGVIGGTPAYMAPEQASDFRAVTPASDIYALGVVAYEMFTGALPFSHENPLSILIMHRETPPPPPRSRNPSLPDELESIILDCLQKDPARRITSCREMGRRVRALRAR
jgi:serine/threonine-protein kinase